MSFKVVEKTVGELSTYLKRGIPPKYCDENGLTVINQRCIRDQVLTLDDSRLHDLEKKSVNEEKYVQKYDVLVNSTGVGTLGRVAQVESDLEATVDTHVTIVRPNDTIVDPHYFGFLMRSIQHKIERLASGSTGQTELRRTALSNIKVKLVDDLDIQRSIASQLTVLDKKIHLNQQTSETLEAMAQAIFKSWFVDFDPVRAKIKARSAGRDPDRAAMATIAGISLDQDWDEAESALDQKLSKMTEEQRQQLTRTAQLFPDELEESEVGEVPKGWEVVEIQDEIDFQNGKAFRSKDLEKDLNKGFRVFKMGNIEKGGGFERIGGNDFLPADFEDDLSRYFLKKGDLLMCMTDMKNNVALLGHTALMDVDDEYVLNQRVGRLRKKENSYLNYPYLYYLTNSRDFIEDLRSRANSGVQVNLSTKEIKASKFLLPPEGVHHHYDKIVLNLLEQIFHNDKENVNLSELRDTLLPKLISGEVGV